ncbi:MAG: 1-acyl-sn-glycerol-3-phosphate acyltransferase, partial [Actinomycetota bacterium]
GAAHVALTANATVLPVLITCNPTTLSKGDPWWLAPEHPFTFRVGVQEAVPTAFFLPEPDKSAIGARRLTDALQQYFSQELKSYGYA